MSFDEKMDAIDLIIRILQDHERTLDELSQRLERVVAKRQGERT